MVESEETKPMSEINKCPECGWILSSSAQECPKCGWSEEGKEEQEKEEEKPKKLSHKEKLEKKREIEEKISNLQQEVKELDQRFFNKLIEQEPYVKKKSKLYEKIGALKAKLESLED
ncbi:MAG: hypothetical protein R6U96_15475 [Promethearchaeia archaeon]